MQSTLSPQQLKEELAHANTVLVDVRTPAEFSRGSLPGSINIPLDALPAQYTTTLPDKSARIVVFCLSGARSAQALTFLEQAGFQHVSHLAGGLLAWRNRERGG